MDWTAFSIAALGIVGTLTSPLIAHKLETMRRQKADERDDNATLRQKLTETYSELDRLQRDANLSSIAAMRLAKGDENVPQLPAFDMSTVRANIGLYFPECAEALQAYDDEIIEHSKKLREELEADPKLAGATWTLMGFASFGKFAREVREKLDARAPNIAILPKPAAG